MKGFAFRSTLILCALTWALGLPVTIPTLAAPPQTPKLTLKDAEGLALRNHPLLQAATFEAEAANQVAREEADHVRKSFIPQPPWVRGPGLPYDGRTPADTRLEQ